MLTGDEIIQQVAMGHIVIDPFDEKRVNPNSYNMRLSEDLLTYAEDELDMKEDNQCEQLKISATRGLVLQPNRLYLGCTMEYTETPHHIPLIEGRSSVARLGLSIHVTAGFGDCGFRGQWVLEITTVHPLRIYSGVEICQIAYFEPNGALRSYAGKYQGQRGPQPSRLWKDFIGR